MVAQAGNYEIGLPPSPDGGWSTAIEVVEGAFVMPPEESDLVQECGVLRSNGSFVDISATWRGRRALMIAPQPPEEQPELLEGRHLFAGQIWSHFGHFMVESLARFWALDHLKEPPESIIFIPKRPGRGQDLKVYQRNFIKLLGVDVPVQVLEHPTQVEELIVPGQGFGLGAIATGTPEYRDYFRQNFATDIAPEGPERLYLSRSALGGMEGSALHEAAIETSLGRDGYVTVHPQEMTIADQVAHYRAAKQVIGLDGSAFHLFGFVGQKSQKAGIILRRNSKVFQSIRTQLRAFAGIDPVVFDAIAADWVPEHKNRPGRYSFGEIDFPVLAKMIHDVGLGPKADQWDIPRFRDMKSAMRAFSDDKGIAFNRIKKEGRRIISGAADGRR